MKISSKGRYAVRTMVELARVQDGYRSVAEIAQSQEISVKYLEKIIGLLVKNKLIVSARGSEGGYKLAKSAEQISVADVLRATNDLPELAPCLGAGQSCPRQNCCDSNGCWSKLNELIVNYLASVSLKNLLDKTF